MQTSPQYPAPFIILFDGVCNLCTTSVQQVIKHVPKEKFKFAALQSKFGQQFLAQHQLPTQAFNTFLLIEQNQLYTRSTAALRVARHLSGLWPLLYIFILVPPFIRNAVYNFIAKNRHKWFGQKNQCWMPTPKLQERFLPN